MGCAADRTALVERGRAAGFVPAAIEAGPFTLFALRRIGRPGGDLRVYLEGDGYAWIERGRPSGDPTPREAVAFALARADAAHPNIAWIARPCQYVAGAERRNCEPRYWTGARYGEAVVAAMSAAIDRLRADAGAARVELVGYSGGGVLAALLAGRRSDVARLVTVAAPLDPAAWTDHHGVSPLDGSLDPVPIAARLRFLPQLHLAGDRDEVVPPATTRRFIAALSGAAGVEARVVAGFDHACCWAERWPALIDEPATRRLR